MTNVPRHQEPAPLDISRLDVGPPLDAEDRGTSDSRALVVVPPLPARRTQDRETENISKSSQKRLPPPAKGKSRASHGHIPDVRQMTPREMQSYSEILYAAGIIGFEDYEAMAFQADLHPAFSKTIGALTGETPGPDRPRNFIRFWQERLNFAKRYGPADAPDVRQAYRILEALAAYPREPDVFA